MNNKNRVFGFLMIALAVLLTVGDQALAQTCDSTGVGRGGRGRRIIDVDGDGIPNGQDPDFTRLGAGRARGFIDTDGDGLNDRFQDFDGDGIPNGKDPDYVRPQDGTGRKSMRGVHWGNSSRDFKGSGNRQGSCGLGTGKASARSGSKGRRNR